MFFEGYAPAVPGAACRGENLTTFHESVSELIFECDLASFTKGVVPDLGARPSLSRWLHLHRSVESIDHDDDDQRNKPAIANRVASLTFVSIDFAVSSKLA
jgi:hypothetical protein